jgi:hypothetical protein
MLGALNRVLFIYLYKFLNVFFSTALRIRINIFLDYKVFIAKRSENLKKTKVP